MLSLKTSLACLRALSPRQLSASRLPVRNQLRYFYRQSKAKSKENKTALAEDVAPKEAAPKDIGQPQPVLEEGFTIGDRIHALVRPTICASSVIGASLVGAVVWQYERRLAKFRTAMDVVTWEDHWSAKAFDARNRLNAWYNGLDAHDRLYYGILAANALVLAGWRVPSLTPFMKRYFLANLRGPAPSISMLGCVFSHLSFVHFGLNMYVLHSFLKATKHFMGPEETFAVYMAGGAVSSWGSYALSALTNRSVVSVGASGAILSLLSLCCVQFPDSQLSIALVSEIIPHSFDASSGLKAVMGLDAVGILMGWKLFDHAAHLSGALFGIIYLKYLRSWFWGEPSKDVLRWWRILRGHDK